MDSCGKMAAKKAAGTDGEQCLSASAVDCTLRTHIHDAWCSDHFESVVHIMCTIGAVTIRRPFKTAKSVKERWRRLSCPAVSKVCGW